jgi:DNA polymerase II small subunit
MDKKELLGFCIEKGILIDGEILGLLEEGLDANSLKAVLEKVREQTNQSLITKSVFEENREKVSEAFLSLPEESQSKLEKLKIRLGLSIEISKEEIIQGMDGGASPSVARDGQMHDEKRHISPVKILMSHAPTKKKIEVSDFHNYYRNRLLETKKILENNPKLENLISISKISGTNQKFSIAGMVYSKSPTKNNNIVLEMEDLTGRIKAVVTKNNPSLYKMAENISLDSVIGIRGSGSKEVLFAREIVLPDTVLLERKKSPVEEAAVFISDVHVGSKNFMEENFLEFIDYLNGRIGNVSESRKIRYLFIVGDLVAGVGIYPNQEKELAIKDIEAQYSKVAELLGKIRSDISIIIIPGNHDCVRLMEPQPILDEKYAWSLYNMKNVTLASNPSVVSIGASGKFPGFSVLLYHGFSYPHYANNIPGLIQEDASRNPDKVMSYLLKNRHLAPSHISVQHSPSEEDSLFIKSAPDIFASGHTHKNAISYHNNILLVSNGCWELLMPYQEKMGFESDYCKVPMFNLKTRETKILDFYNGDDKDGKDDHN